MIRFTVPGPPKGKGRPRVTRWGTYTPEATREYEEKVRRCWKEQSGETFPDGTPLIMYIKAYMPIPKSTGKRRAMQMENQPHTHKPDWDNIGKIVADALNGLAYHDDSAVFTGFVEKLYSKNERAECYIFTRDEWPDVKKNLICD